MNAQLFPTLTAQSCQKGDYLQAMAHAVTGVGIVATDGPAGRMGITVSSMASVSAEPPLLLVCLRADSPSAAAVAANGRFSLSLLHQGQDALADTFAGRPRTGDAYAFSAATWVQAPGELPRVAAASATFICEVVSAQPVGSHLLLIGQVTGCSHEDSLPLLYCARQYGMPVAL
ncbi:flavin reductase family protein [Pseudomonas sp. dw_358]|uniref:flavin reductase family protein n=1 Tax=Pseudomonas sp. dw_358 TaxID=2720083 RepID=UPI001BD4D66F|nr:flavin reductase family protein [Pseudomonas sp. dw_358]